MMRSTIIILPVIALLLSGCLPDPVGEIRSHEFAAGTSLEQAYNSLLDNISWQKVKVDGTSYVEVRGIVKGTTDSLAVRYETKPRPPVVASFEHQGKAGTAAQFATFLHKLQLRRAILAQTGAGA